MEEIVSFYNYLKKLINILQKNKNIIFNSKQKRKIIDFIDNVLPSYKKESEKDITLKSVFVVYILTFMVTIQELDFMNEKDIITKNSIMEGLTNNPAKDMHILITIPISFNKIWLRFSEEDNEKLVNILNNLYINALLVETYLKEKNMINDELVNFIKPKITVYKTAMKGRGEMAKHLIKHSVNKNESLDKMSKKEVKKATEIVIDDAIDNMDKCDIKSDKDINVETLLFDKNASEAVKNTTKNVRDKIKSGALKKNNLADLLSSLFGSGVDHEAVKKDPKLRLLMSTLAAQMKFNSKKHAKQLMNDPIANKLTKEIIDKFYDPNIKSDPKLLKKYMGKLSKKQKIRVRK